MPNNTHGWRAVIVTVRFGESLSKRALVDTGACGNAKPQSFYHQQKTIENFKTGDLEDPDFSIVKLASGKKLNIVGQMEATFSFAGN